MLRLITTHSLLRLCLLLAVTALGACAATPGRTTTEDQWEGMNRHIYKFNEVVDRATTKPLAKGYRAVTPQWLRTGISNFFNNLETPWDIANELLQGKPQLMAQDTCRFVFNTIVGLGGFIDVASKFELHAHDEDFGQTLAVWGVPSGPYVMLPLVGPATIRDAAGRVPDFFSGPLHNADIPWETETGLWVVELVDWRSDLLSVEGTLDQAYDKYGVIRDAWLQRREYLIFDGNPPETVLEEDFGMEDDAAETSPDAGNEAVPPITP